LAINIQHDGLRETSKGDLWTLEAVVQLNDLLCHDFTLGWLVEEFSPNLPKELDFVHKAHNSERAAKQLQEAGLGFDRIVSKIH
jgi:aarF domain-containing kinase